MAFGRSRERAGNFKAGSLVQLGQCEALKGREVSLVESGLAGVPRRQHLFGLALAEYKVTGGP